MPWAPLQPIGVGAGAAAGADLNQQQSNRQQDFVAQLLMHMQQMQAQREQTNAFKQLQLASLTNARESAAADRTARENQQIVNQVPQGTDLPTSQVQGLGNAAIGRFSPLNTLPSQQTSGSQPLQPGAMSQITGPSTTGTGTAGETQVQTMSSPPQPTGMSRKLPSDIELDRESRDRATNAQREFTNALSMRKVGDTEGNAANRSDLDWSKFFAAQQKAQQGRQPSFQEVDQVSNMNSAEIQAVKVLQQLKQSGLDKSNDPMDPRWNTFLAQNLKIRPQDEGKADAVQRTAYVKAVLGRAIMGGRPSQYVMQMIEQHLPDSKMSGKQLSGVINDVLDEVRTKRVNMQNFYGGAEAQKMEPVGGMTYAQWLQGQQGQGTGPAAQGFKIERQ